MKLNVAVKLRITPIDIDTDLDEISRELAKISESYGRLHSSETKPIAFGLNCLEAILLLDDSMGGIDEIEKKLRILEQVSEVDVLDVNRL
jgi:translation elongation factor aEF-1 beta